MSEIIVEFPSPLTDREKKMIYGYKGEVVRCKDCKYSDWWGPEGKETFNCIRFLDVPPVTPDFYCAWGEKKE